MKFKAVIAPLVRTIVNVFDLQCHIHVVPKESSSHHKTGLWSWSPQQGKQIITTAQFFSTELSLTVALCFTEEVYLKFVSGMFGETFSEMNDDIQDLASEWLNIVLGHIKSHLNDDLKEDFSNSIPMTMQGNHLVFNLEESFPIVKIPFTSTEGAFSCLLLLTKDLVIPWESSFFQLQSKKNV